MCTFLRRRINGVDVVSDSGYASIGIEGVLGLGGDIRAGGDTALCLLLLTHRSIIGMYSFLKRHIDTFTCHGAMILIGSLTAKTLLEGLTENPVAFINISNSLESITGELKMVLNIPTQMRSKQKTLTRCEQRILTLFLQGYSARLISKMIGISEKTISSQKRTVMKKYDVNSMVLLAMKYSLDKSLCNALAASTC